jgi:hypothetical protein
MSLTTEELVLNEGWEVTTSQDGKKYIEAFGRRFNFNHPAAIHLTCYRTEKNPERRYFHMKAAHDYLWPHHRKTWHKWTEDRFRAHCEGWKCVTMAGGAAIGKAQPLSSKIRTPSGWIAMKDIKVGDTICDTQGGIQTVLKLHPQGIKDIYKVSFSDGSECFATEDHLWDVQSKKQTDRKEGKRHLYTTRECIKNLAHRLAVPSIAPLAGIDSNLPISPWLMGYYIANGSCSCASSSPTITAPSKELVAKIATYWPKISVRKLKNHYVVVPLKLRAVIKSFPELNLKKSISKEIPSSYLYASKEDRLELLRGLVDGDGHCNGATIEVSFSNKTLGHQTLELARSLGYIATIRRKSSGYKKNGALVRCNDSYRVFIHGSSELPPPATVPHKIPIKNRVSKSRRKITAITLSHRQEAQCITVSSQNHLYITDDLIPTHNSLDAAKIACMFWLAAPKRRGVVVMSTTLEALNSRIYGYVTKLLTEMQVKFQYQARSGNNPKIVFPGSRDNIHTIAAVAAKLGDEDKAIASLIGRHPDEGLLVILDECTDLPMAILGAVPNLSQGVETFQLIGIGNSASKNDLHGALCTPKVGWDNIDPLKDIRWETNQRDGVCLFFSCYNSPAIYEENAAKKELLSKFLITKEEIDEKKKLYGADSDSFWRFVLGFWRTGSADETVISKQFLDHFRVYDKAEWAGLTPLMVCAGLDPAFSVGGDKCILRLGLLGTDVTGLRVLDFRRDSLLFRVPISAVSKDSVEIQIADYVIAVLKHHNCPLGRLCIDGSGAGRALGEVIRLRSGTGISPIRIYSARFGESVSKSSFDVKVISAHELWFTFREFIQRRQIRGIDSITAHQLFSRRVLLKGGKQVLEPKQEYRSRMSAVMPSLGTSPDEADGSALCLQSAIMTCGFAPGQKHEMPRLDNWIDRKMYAFTEQAKLQQIEESHSIPEASFGTSLEASADFLRLKP